MESRISYTVFEILFRQTLDHSFDMLSSAAQSADPHTGHQILLRPKHCCHQSFHNQLERCGNRDFPICRDDGRDSKERAYDNWSHTSPTKLTISRELTSCAELRSLVCCRKIDGLIFLAPIAAGSWTNQTSLQFNKCVSPNL